MTGQGGLPTCFAEAAALSGELYRAVENRETRRCRIDQRYCFVKTQRPLPVGELIKNLVTLRLPVFDTGTEARALTHLRAAGVPVAAVLGHGREGLVRRRSWLVLGEITHQGSLETLLQQEQLDRASRAQLAAALGDLVRRLHDAGVNHRDLYLCHVLVDHRQTLHLLDLHRAQLRPTVPRRWREKDLAALLYSALALAVTATEQRRFLVRYCAGAGRSLRTDGRFWARVWLRVRRMQARAARHGIQDFARREPR